MEDRMNDNSRQQNDNRTGIISEYIAEEKDTLSDLCRRYNVSLHEIKAANPDIDDTSDMIQPGRRIMIPRKEQ